MASGPPSREKERIIDSSLAPSPRVMSGDEVNSDADAPHFLAEIHAVSSSADQGAPPQPAEDHSLLFHLPPLVTMPVGDDFRGVRTEKSPLTAHRLQSSRKEMEQTIPSIAASEGAGDFHQTRSAIGPDESNVPSHAPLSPGKAVQVVVHRRVGSSSFSSPSSLSSAPLGESAASLTGPVAEDETEGRGLRVGSTSHCFPSPTASSDDASVAPVTGEALGSPVGPSHSITASESLAPPPCVSHLATSLSSSFTADSVAGDCGDWEAADPVKGETEVDFTTSSSSTSSMSEAISTEDIGAPLADSKRGFVTHPPHVASSTDLATITPSQLSHYSGEHRTTTDTFAPLSAVSPTDEGVSHMLTDALTCGHDIATPVNVAARTEASDTTQSRSTIRKAPLLSGPREAPIAGKTAAKVQRRGRAPLRGPSRSPAPVRKLARTEERQEVAAATEADAGVALTVAPDASGDAPPISVDDRSDSRDGTRTALASDVSFLLPQAASMVGREAFRGGEVNEPASEDLKSSNVVSGVPGADAEDLYAEVAQDAMRLSDGTGLMHSPASMPRSSSAEADVMLNEETESRVCEEGEKLDHVSGALLAASGTPIAAEVMRSPLKRSSAPSSPATEDVSVPALNAAMTPMVPSTALSQRSSRPQKNLDTGSMVLREGGSAASPLSSTPSLPPKPVLNIAGVNVQALLAEGSDPPPVYLRRPRRTRRKRVLSEGHPLFSEHRDLWQHDVNHRTFACAPFATDADVLKSLMDWTDSPPLVYARLLWRYAPQPTVQLAMQDLATAHAAVERHAGAGKETREKKREANSRE